MSDKAREPFKIEEDFFKSSFIKKIEIYFYKFLFLIFKRLPVNKKKITIISFHHDYLYGNNKAITKQLLLQKPEYDLKFVFKKDTSFDNVFSIKKLITKIRMSYLYNTSKYIILDDFYGLLSEVKFKKNIEIIQVWHGTGVFKKFGATRHNITPELIDRLEKVGKQYSVVLASCDEIVPLLSKSFLVEKDKIKAIGSPKSDIFFDKNYIADTKEKFFDENLELIGKKIIVYAPTYRDYDRNKDISLDINKMYDELFKLGYIVVLKLHHLERGNITHLTQKYHGFVYDFSTRDIDDIMIVADILITDYSSLIFEYSVLQKPLIFYAYDLELYSGDTRGFYYPYEEFAPAPIVQTTDETISLIKQDKWDKESLKRFSDRFIANQGFASKYFVDGMIA